MGTLADDGLVHRTDEQLPVTAFVHVVDCRAGERAESEAVGEDCSDERAGNLYIQYWLYYANSATLHGVPVVGDAGEHKDDWESVQVRINSDGSVDERASAHDGYDYSDWPSTGARTPGSASSATSPKTSTSATRTAGARRPACSSFRGSHVGNAAGAGGSRFTRPPRPPGPVRADRRRRPRRPSPSSRPG